MRKRSQKAINKDKLDRAKALVEEMAFWGKNYIRITRVNNFKCKTKKQKDKKLCLQLLITAVMAVSKTQMDVIAHSPIRTEIDPDAIIIKPNFKK